MDIINIQDRNPDIISEITALWRRSVKKTHSFLSDDEIDEIENFVPHALQAVEHLIIVRDKNNCLGFMGIDQQRLEMLFVEPQFIGQRIGRKLIEYGIKHHRVNEVTVNEQNPQAVGFYTHLGFKLYKRTDVDEQGRPFPLLYLRK